MSSSSASSLRVRNIFTIHRSVYSLQPISSRYRQQHQRISIVQTHIFSYKRQWLPPLPRPTPTPLPVIISKCGLSPDVSTPATVQNEEKDNSSNTLSINRQHRFRSPSHRQRSFTRLSCHCYFAKSFQSQRTISARG